MPPAGPASYPEVSASPRFPAIEEAILDRWAAEGTFLASVDARPSGERSSNEYVFYDGPPFANGLPHYGHLLTGYVKDAVPRYQTMRGRRVERRFGWDCHGLPAETQAERELGVSGRGPITEYGIGRFNDYCRTSVLRFTHEWEHYVTRQARWVDFDNDYKTMDPSYMESVMWAFKQLYDKGLLYEEYRVLPYCWECETPLSNSETRVDDAYRDRQDPAVTVELTLEPDPTADPLVAGEVGVWIWTTTPWTLPSNLAAAVGPDIAYSVYERDGRRVVLGKARTEAYAADLEGWSEVGVVRGAQLTGRRYKPLFPYFAATPNAFVVLPAEWVTTEDGTGIVQMAPGFGEDDQTTCAAAGIPVVCPVDSRTRFTAEVPDFEGLQVFEANQPVIRALRDSGVVIRVDSYNHAYPHCWRTDTPLVYRAVTSWFVNVTAIKPRLLENAKTITWIPSHVKDGAFGHWLAGARDWSISRNRFWGSPIPVWKSDDPAYPRIDVYGSLDELEADFGVRPGDLHRPAIDELTRPNPDDPTGRSVMRRVTEVLDCWFESGSMPFAQLHYPFDNVERFEEHFPGDFIVEYIGQTRTWFYVLHVMATALFDQAAFRTCVAHGNILGNDGRKMSKRLRNFPDPEEMFDRHGADAVRWYLFSSPVLRGGDFIVDEKGMTRALRAVVLPLWNAWYFFTLYANADSRRARLGATTSTNVLDRYVVAKTHDLVAEVTAEMDAYDLSGAAASVETYLDALTNWYVRRSRDRFWATGGDADVPDTQAAFDTLGTVLEVLCRVLAPLLPLTADAIWSGLTGGGSVHLADWPSAAELPADPGLVAAMDSVRDVCSAAHSVRKAAGLRSRLPLRSLTVASPSASSLDPFVDLIRGEVNVGKVDLTAEVASFADQNLVVLFRVAAPRLGELTPRVAAAAKSGDWELLGDGRARVGTAELEEGEFELQLRPHSEATSRTLPGRMGLVVLDTESDPEQEIEGLARDVVREVQRGRRDAGLNVSDRIKLELDGSPEVLEAIEVHRVLLVEACLVTDLALVPSYSDAVSSPTGATDAAWVAAELDEPNWVAFRIARSLA